MTPPASEAPTPKPLLSIVVTIVEGGLTLRRLLEAIQRQEAAPLTEVLVAFDASIADVGLLAVDFPGVRFLPMGEVATHRSPDHPAGQHELFDRRRAFALKAAGGALVAILEDRAPPRPDWAARMVRLHGDPFAVIGGAIESAAADALGWALYVCDFDRYGLPFESGPREWISDVNICYKRSALEATRHLWTDRYHEPAVHWALAAAGETLYLSNEPVVDHRRSPQGIWNAVRERFAWGRLFGYIRAKQMSPLRRLALTLLGPVIPLRLLVRYARTQRRRGEGARFLRTAPLIGLLLIAWSAGEVGGYLTRRP